MQGGDWEYATSGILGSNSLQSEDKRKSVFTRASYEVLPGVEAFLQASYARYEGLSYYIVPTTTGITIQRENAFLPASVMQRMQDAGVTSFQMGTSNEDMPASGSANERATKRFVTGAKGSFALAGKDFNWDGYYQKGITDVREQLTPTYNVNRLTWRRTRWWTRAPAASSAARPSPTRQTGACR